MIALRPLQPPKPGNGCRAGAAGDRLRKPWSNSKGSPRRLSRRRVCRPPRPCQPARRYLRIRRRQPARRYRLLQCQPVPPCRRIRRRQLARRYRRIHPRQPARLCRRIHQCQPARLRLRRLFSLCNLSQRRQRLCKQSRKQHRSSQTHREQSRSKRCQLTRILSNRMSQLGWTERIVSGGLALTPTTHGRSGSLIHSWTGAIIPRTSCLGCHRGARVTNGSMLI